MHQHGDADSVFRLHFLLNLLTLYNILAASLNLSDDAWNVPRNLLKSICHFKGFGNTYFPQSLNRKIVMNAINHHEEF